MASGPILRTRPLEFRARYCSLTEPDRFTLSRATYRAFPRLRVLVSTLTTAFPFGREVRRNWNVMDGFSMDVLRVAAGWAVGALDLGGVAEPVGASDDQGQAGGNGGPQPNARSDMAHGTPPRVLIGRRHGGLEAPTGALSPGHPQLDSGID